MTTDEERCVCILFSVRLDAPFSSSIVVPHVSALLLYCYYLLFFCPLGFCWAFSISAFLLFPSFHVPFFFVPLLTEALHDCVEATSRSFFFLRVFFVSCFCTLKKNAPFPPCFALADICFSSLLLFQCMIYLVAFFFLPFLSPFYEKSRIDLLAPSCSRPFALESVDQN